jgi:predicted methyltransferase
MMSIRLIVAACALACATAVSAADTDQPAGAVPPPTSAGEFTSARMAQVLAGNWRSSENRARDRYRHPQQTLAFFHVRPDMTVMEITPGAGWYSEILAPLLKDNGHYIAAVAGEGKGTAAMRKKFADDPTQYGKADVAPFDDKAPVLGAPGSVDAVLTFRNVHNWVMADNAPAMFKAFFDVLKPGGVLGVVDHRAAKGADLAKIKQSGYLPVEYVVKLATDAGFKLEASSEINANPKDLKNYPQGVWTLPPTLTLGDKDRATYLAIGESDRMTLRFVRPAAPGK